MMEELLNKFMAESAKRHNEHSSLIKEIRASMDATIKNQGALIKALEIQIEKMSKVLQEKGSGSLPSLTKTNPRDHVKSITTTEEAETVKEDDKMSLVELIQYPLIMKDPDPKPPNIDSSSSVKLSKKLDKNVSSKPLRKSNRKNTIRMSSNGSTGKSLDEDGYGEEELEEMEVKDAEVIDTLYEVSNGDKASSVDNMGKNIEIPILVHLNFVLNPDLVNNVFSNNNLEIMACLRRKIGRIWKILLAANNGSNKLRLVPVHVNEEGKKLIDLDPLLKKEAGDSDREWTLVGRSETSFLFRNGRLGFVLNLLRFFSGLRSSTSQLKHEMLKVLAIILPQKKDESSPVKIFNIPVEARNAKGISIIARRVGTPIIMDRITTSMCEKAYGRASYARVLIEIDASEGLIDSIDVCYKSLGRSMSLRVEYPWTPPVCSFCRVFGHSFEACKSRELTEVEILKKAESKGKQAQKVNEGQGNKAEWKSVSYKKVLKNAGGGYVNQEYQGGNRNVNYVESDITP
ncbi:zinc knuckle CX2CX4HX4C containing protein [Tanacetum coccineum]